MVDTWIESEPIKNAENLRSVLRRAELDLADLKVADAESVVVLLHMVDDLESGIPRLEAELKVDLKPERTRLQTIENILRSRTGLAVRRAGADRLELERERVNPSADEWWWRLDLILSASRQRRVRRLAMYGLAAAAVLLVATVAYNIFLAPTPEERALAESVSAGEGYLIQGDFDAAVKEFEAAVALSPDEAGNHLYLAVAVEAQGDTDRAAAELAEGRRLSDSEAEYRASLSLVYYRVGASGNNPAALARAEEEANASIAADPNYALGHFALGSAYELQGRSQEAIMEFELTSDLSSDASLTVLARMRMGMLMQSPSGSAAPSETTTPTS
ncbi:MAG: tetratricopeptide repeat protein [Anaerolineae bacterium]